MGRFDGKVVFITGGARGQGRSHALQFAEEGADVITLDICQQVESVDAPMPTREDLDETARQVEKLGRRVIATSADVRDFAAVQAVVDEGLSEFGSYRLRSGQRRDLPGEPRVRYPAPRLLRRH